MSKPVRKRKFSAMDIAKEAQKLYNPKDKKKSVIGTGASLTRPTEDADFVLAPEDHPWRHLTGLKGLPWDIVTQVAGAPDSGKSTIAGQFMGWAQQQGVYVILWDTERKFDKIRFEKHFGGDASELQLITSTTIRTGGGAAFKLIHTTLEKDPDAKILLVHDSVGGSVSRSRAEREFDDEKHAQPGSEAVENSDYMRHMISMFDKYPGHIAVLLINQMTMKIGPMPGKSRSGGEKISFHSSLIIEMTRIQDLKRVSKGVTLKTGILSRAKAAKGHLSTSDESVYEMRIKVDAKGWAFVDGGSVAEDESDE